MDFAGFGRDGRNPSRLGKLDWLAWAASFNREPSSDLGLIDEYRLYFHPVVLGRGKPFFAGPRPPLRLVSTDPVGEDTVRLTYVPA